jgi:hypothetical protein
MAGMGKGAGKRGRGEEGKGGRGEGNVRTVRILDCKTIRL